MTLLRINSAIKNYGDTNFITGMRAYAALAVVLIHTGGGGLREFGLLGNNFVDFCKTGVIVFFAISGFSVADSYKRSKGYTQYLLKRLFRIAPLYYFWIFFCVIFSTGEITLHEVFWSNIGQYSLLMHLSFLSF